MSEGETREILRDHFPECLSHLARCFREKVPSGSKGKKRQLKPIADFCGVTPKAVVAWFDFGILPKGLPKLKITCILSLLGYKVIEFEKLPKILRYFVEMIGFGVIDINDALEISGFKAHKNLLAVLHGTERLTDEKHNLLFGVMKTYLGVLDQRKEELSKSRRFDFFIKDHDVAEMTPPKVVVPKAEKSRVSGDQTQVSAVLSIREALTMFKRGAFQDLSDNDIANMNRNDADAILSLWTYLGSLSSRIVEVRKGGSRGQ